MDWQGQSDSEWRTTTAADSSSGGCVAGEGVSGLEPVDFDRLFDELSQMASCRRDKINEVKRLVQSNQYATQGKLRVALERLLVEIGPSS